MAQLINADQVTDVLFTIKGFPLERRPAGLTPGIIEQRIRTTSAEILNRVGGATPAEGTNARDALNGLCLDLVCIGIRRDFFGLSPDAVNAINIQETNAWRRVDAMQAAPAFEGDQVRFHVGGARPP